MASKFILFLCLLCHVQLWIVCRSNSTTSVSVSDTNGFDGKSPDPFVDEFTIQPPDLPTVDSDQGTTVPEELSSDVEDTLSPLLEEENDVLSSDIENQKPATSTAELPETIDGEKCVHETSGCLSVPPSEDLTTTTSASTMSKVQQTTLSSTENSILPGATAKLSNSSEEIKTGYSVPSTSPTSLSSVASASENLIVAESPSIGRKENQNELKEATVSISHQDKTEDGKVAPDRHISEDNIGDSGKPTTEAGGNLDIRNDGTDSPQEHRDENRIPPPVPTVDFSKPLDTHQTSKDVTKIPFTKSSESTKKTEKQSTEPSKTSLPTHAVTDSSSTREFVENSTTTTKYLVVTTSMFSLTTQSVTVATTVNNFSSNDFSQTETMTTESAIAPPSTGISVETSVSPSLWITNQSCADLPVCIQVHLSRSPCSVDDETVRGLVRSLVVKTVSGYVKTAVRPIQVVLEPDCSEDHHVKNNVLFYLTDSRGEYEESLTSIAGVLLRKAAKRAADLNSSQMLIVKAKLVERGTEEDASSIGEEAQTLPTPPPLIVAHHSGMVAAVAISAVAGACLCLLCLLMIIMKQRLAAQQQHQSQQANGHRPPNALDAYSLDSFSINASFRRRRPGRSSASSFTNHAFVTDNGEKALFSKVLSTSALAAALRNHRNVIEDEFEKIPMNMPKPREVPPGAEVKNRFANVVPNPKTRVMLSDKSDDPVKTYINANYVRGHDGRQNFYIACQAPLPEYVGDFWKMVWEQQSRVILMLTMLEENSLARCAPYFPDSTLDCRQLHGDYQVSLLKKDIREFYTVSTFRLFDIDKNLFREVMHFWYTAWPAVGVPNDPMSLVTYLIQARPYINCNSGPTVVHCSAGTGRTGTVIAIDRCMRQYEASHTVDIVQCVAQIRRDRGGSVQNKQQYLLIYEALMEYASLTANQSNRPSIQSND